VLGYLGTQTPVYDHLTLSRACTFLYFSYFFALPVLNIVDLYFFEDKQEVAKNHIKQLVNSIKLFIFKIINISLVFIKKLINGFNNFKI